MSFDPYNIWLSLMFSLVGFVAWRYGKNSQSGRHMVLGAALMFFGYFVSQTWMMLLVGAILTALLFWP